MASRLTIHDYYTNPTQTYGGWTNAKKEFNERYEKLLKNNKGKFKTVIYRERDMYYIHIIIPSEGEAKLSYDVVIQISRHSFLSPLRVPIKVVNNCPSFVFTYAYVYHNEDKMINILKGIYEDEVLRKPPVIRNDDERVGFEKTLWYAVRYIRDHFNSFSKMDAISTPFDIDRLLYSVRKSDEILLETKLYSQIKQSEKKEEKEKEKRENTRSKISLDDEQTIKPSNLSVGSKKSSSTKVANVAKRSKTASRVKRR